MSNLKIFLSFIFVLIISTTIQAQNENEFNRYGLQFGVNSNFTLKSFNNSSFSGKYLFSPKRGIRFSVALNGYSKPIERSVADQIDRNENENAFQILLIPEYFLRLTESYDTYFYILGGPRFGFNFFENSSEYLSDYSTPSNSRKRVTYTLGVQIGSGVEYFFRENMSLNAEYALLIDYIFITDELNTEIKTLYKQDSIYLQPLNVLFGLSVYF